MFIPYRDGFPNILIPYVTWFILGFNILIFIYQLIMDPYDQQSFVYSYAAVPGEITGQLDFVGNRPFPAFFTLITSLFLHGGVTHLLSNMIFLYVFAENLESVLGHRLFLLYYLLCGLLATLTQVLISSHSSVPIVGASGAISGVMGGYMLRYPAARIHVLVFIFPMVLPAALIIGVWFILQLLNGFSSAADSAGGVAWFAHIGGFIAGSGLMVLISKGRFYWLKP